MKKKCLLLKLSHRRERLDWAERHKEYTLEDWKRVVWSDETKINHIGSDERKWIWKEVGEKLTDRQVEGTLKFGGGNVMMWGVCSGKVLDIPLGLKEGWMHNFTASSWRMNCNNLWSFIIKLQMILYFNRTMTPSTPANWPKDGSMTMVTLL